MYGFVRRLPPRLLVKIPNEICIKGSLPGKGRDVLLNMLATICGFDFEVFAGDVEIWCCGFDEKS